MSAEICRYSLKFSVLILKNWLQYINFYKNYKLLANQNWVKYVIFSVSFL